MRSLQAPRSCTARPPYVLQIEAPCADGAPAVQYDRAPCGFRLDAEADNRGPPTLLARRSGRNHLGDGRLRTVTALTPRPSEGKAPATPSDASRGPNRAVHQHFVDAVALSRAVLLETCSEGRPSGTYGKCPSDGPLLLEARLARLKNLLSLPCRPSSPQPSSAACARGRSRYWPNLWDRDILLPRTPCPCCLYRTTR